MSHHTNENSICPNCGFATTHNYCAQCGQETHLHKETFWGLVMHFVGHYFHYDSKFWMTIKALLFHPGKLATAYWNKQRMRYIPPISLYIFTSAIFFIAMAVSPEKMFVASKGEMRFDTDAKLAAAKLAAQDSANQAKALAFANEKKLAEAQTTHDSLNAASLTGSDSTATAHKIKDTSGGIANKSAIKGLKVSAGQKQKTEEHKTLFEYDAATDTANLTHLLAVHLNRLDEKTDGKAGEYVVEHIYHTIPKVFFFMIPLMAFLLGMLFFKRGINFVNHSIFSLQYHSFVFTVLILMYLPVLKDISVTKGILTIVSFSYLVVALHNAYQTKWLKAFFSALFVAVAYSLFLALAILADFIIIVLLA